MEAFNSTGKSNSVKSEKYKLMKQMLKNEIKVS